MNDLGHFPAGGFRGQVPAFCIHHHHLGLRKQLRQVAVPVVGDLCGDPFLCKLNAGIQRAGKIVSNHQKTLHLS